jgi:hypothetical protein
MSIYIKHKHHIVPKHMGGSDDPSNLVELTIEEHAKAHKKLWEEHGHWQDELAWKGLSGMSSKGEIIQEIMKRNGERWGAANKGKIAWNKGLTLEDPRVQKYHRTGHKINNSENMGKYIRTEEIKDKLRYPKSQEHRDKLSEASKLQFSDEEFKLKFSKVMKNNRDVCPHCNMESNKSNITRHRKVCKLKN